MKGFEGNMFSDLGIVSLIQSFNLGKLEVQSKGLKINLIRFKINPEYLD